MISAICRGWGDYIRVHELVLLSGSARAVDASCWGENSIRPLARRVARWEVLENHGDAKILQSRADPVGREALSDCYHLEKSLHGSETIEDLAGPPDLNRICPILGLEIPGDTTVAALAMMACGRVLHGNNVRLMDLGSVWRIVRFGM